MFRRLGMGILVPAAFSAMFGGRRLTKHREITQLADLEAVTLLANRGPFPWQVDGDYLGEVERLDVRYEPDALTLVIP
jgi:diacylglycerol kinase family enzyme